MEYIRFLRENARWLSAGAILTLSSSFGQTFFISIFAGAIRDDFALSHGAWGGIYTIGTTASAIVMIWAGILTDRFRVRKLGAIVLLMLAAACLILAVAPTVSVLIFGIFALRFTGQGLISHMAVVATARWFVATRGRALSIVTMGFAFGQALLPVVFVALMSIFHWQTLWIFAAILAVAAIPVLLLLLSNERTPQSIVKEMPAAGMNGRHWHRRDVLRHWLFWLILPTILGPSAWGTALFFQQINITEVKGWSHVEFVALFPLLTFISVIFTFISGWAVDRFGTNRLISLYLLPYALSFLIIGQTNSLSVAALGMMVFGAAIGSGGPILGAFWAEHFGTQNLGGIKAMATSAMVFGSAIGPGISGWLIDLGISFPDQMLGYSVFFMGVAAIAAFATRLARPGLFIPT